TRRPRPEQRCTTDERSGLAWLGERRDFQRQVPFATLNERGERARPRGPVAIDRHPARETSQFPGFNAIGTPNLHPAFNQLLPSRLPPTEIGHPTGISRPGRPRMDKAGSILTAGAIFFPVPSQLTYLAGAGGQGKNIAASTDVN